MNHPQSDLDRVRNIISHKAAEIASCFKPGAMVTVVIRNPGVKNADVVISAEEDMTPVIEAIQSLYKFENKRG